METIHIIESIEKTQLILILITNVCKMNYKLSISLAGTIMYIIYDAIWHIYGARLLSGSFYCTLL